MTAPAFPAPTPAQSARASVAHTVLRDVLGVTDEKDRAQILAQAQNVLSTAQALSAQQSLVSLGSAQTLMNGAATALNLTGDPRLKEAAGLLTQLSGVASQVQSAIQGGQSVPLALATAAAGFLPAGAPRDLALSVLQAVNFATASDTPELTSAQGMLGTLLQHAMTYAQQEAQNIQDPTLRAAAGLALPFLGQLIGGGQEGAQKFTPGALMQVGVDLLYLATQREQETP